MHYASQFRFEVKRRLARYGLAQHPFSASITSPMDDVELYCAFVALPDAEPICVQHMDAEGALLQLDAHLTLNFTELTQTPAF
jgi:hypothetical protein